ncbi:hypothetical protein GJV06_13140 [Enterobacteriaceae bacterium RIT691]|nr:hypothetical protein [Enterobacteriaceae bacterium RIT691]
MYKILVIFTTVYFLAASVLVLVLMYINERKFKVICDIYFSEFKKLPIAAKTLYHASPLGFITGNSLKKDFIIHPLISERKSILSGNNKDVEFILGLDKKLTNSFKWEHYISVMGSFILMVLIGLIYLFK